MMLNKNINDECIFLKSDELVHADIRKTVKRWHHTNSTAIVGYISNTPPNLRSARN